MEQNKEMSCTLRCRKREARTEGAVKRSGNEGGAIRYDDRNRFGNRDVRLSVEQVKLLKAAESTGYFVKVLSGIVDNSRRIVVLLGDNGLKDKEADRVGTLNLEVFSLRGIEGKRTEPRDIFRFLGKQAERVFYELNNSSITQRAFEVHPKEGYAKNIRLGPEENKYLEAYLNTTEVMTPGLLYAANINSYLYALFLYNLFQTVCGDYYSRNEGYSISYGSSEGDNRLKQLLCPLTHYLTDYRNHKVCKKVIEIFQKMPGENVMLVITEKYRPGHMAHILESTHDFKEMNVMEVLSESSSRVLSEHDEAHERREEHLFAYLVELNTTEGPGETDETDETDSEWDLLLEN